MDAFKVHDRLIRDYRSFTEGFVEIRDQRIREHVEEQAAHGAQWPAPWLALNPAFAPGGRIDELVRDGLLHPSASGSSGRSGPSTTRAATRSRCTSTSGTPSRWPEPALPTC